MKNNRFVGIGICGTVVGLLLGAGSVVYGKNMLTGSLVRVPSSYVYRTDRFDEAYKKRSHIEVHDREAYGDKQRAEKEKVVEKNERARCTDKIAIIEDVRMILDEHFPKRPIDRVLLATIEEELDLYLRDCIAFMVPEEESVDVHESAPEIDRNYCNKFTGKRRGNCIDSFRRGVKFEPWYK